MLGSAGFGKKGCAGIIVKGTGLKIELIDFHQKMQIEKGYQTVISNYGFCGNFET